TVLSAALDACADRGASAVGELPCAGDEIRMHVRVDRVRDREPVLPRKLDVVIDVALGVDDRRDAGDRIADEVGVVGDAAGLELLEDYARRQFRGLVGRRAGTRDGAAARRPAGNAAGQWDEEGAEPEGSCVFEKLTSGGHRYDPWFWLWFPHERRSGCRPRGLDQFTP